MEALKKARSREPIFASSIFQEYNAAKLFLEIRLGGIL
jgi:hypothetical protein